MNTTNFRCMDCFVFYFIYLFRACLIVCAWSFCRSRTQIPKIFCALLGAQRFSTVNRYFLAIFPWESRNLCWTFPRLPSPRSSGVTQTSLKCKLWWLPVSTQILRFDYRQNLAKNCLGMSLHQVAIDIAEVFCCILILFKNNVAYWRIKLNGMHSVWVVFAN